jgi:hypothetical protein
MTGEIQRGEFYASEAINGQASNAHNSPMAMTARLRQHRPPFLLVHATVAYQPAFNRWNIDNRGF